jgi:hypothetical protein
MKRLLSANPDTGTKTYFHSTPEHVHIESVQDVTNVVEAAKAKFNDTDERAKWGEWQRVASIPLVTFYDLKRKGITEDPAAMKKWLNDPDNRFFRTRPGRL